MTVAAVVALQTEGKRISTECPAIEFDLAGEHGVGMRRSGKADPTFITQRYLKGGVVQQAPCDLMTIDTKRPAARAFVNCIVGNTEMKWRFCRAHNFDFITRKSLNEALRRPSRRKPRRPDLRRRSKGISVAAIASGIHEQVTKPTRAGAVGETETQEPYLVAATRGQRRKWLIQACQRFPAHFENISQYHLASGDQGHCVAVSGES